MPVVATAWPRRDALAPGNDHANVPHGLDTGETVATWAGTSMKIAATPVASFHIMPS
jgi:hypothetical protein